MKKLIIVLFLLVFVASSQAQLAMRGSPIIQGEYFVGSDPSVGQGIPIQINNQQANISVNLYNISLLPKTPIYVRFKNSNGYWSKPKSISYPGHGFNRDAYISQLEYFIDNDPGVGNGNPLSITSTNRLDINLTSISFNKNQKFYLRVKDAEERWSKPVAFSYPQRWIRLAEVIVGNNPSTIPVGQGNIMEAADGIFDSGFETVALTIANWNKQDTIWVRVQSSEYLWSIPIGTLFIAPTVVTNPPSFIGSTNVELEGTVNPNGFLTTAYFEWDTSNVFNNENFTASKTINAGNSSFTITETINDLEPEQTYYYRIIAENEGGKTKGNIISFNTNVVSVKTNEDIPEEFALSQNYPNPFNPGTTISYSIPQSSFVNITVYNILGKEVARLLNEQKQPGYYEVKFDGSNLSSGVYFYRLQSGSFSDAKKFVLMK